MPLECHWLTQCTLEYNWATQHILAGYTGTPLEKLSWNSPPPSTGMSLEKLSWNCPTLGCHWINSNFCSLHWNTTGGTVTAHTRPVHIVKQSSIHASLKWQDGGTPISKWTGRCKFSLYLEFTALQWIPVLLLTYVSTSTSLYACLWCWILLIRILAANFSEILSEIHIFSFNKIHLKISPAKWRQFLSRSQCVNSVRPWRISKSVK